VGAVTTVKAALWVTRLLRVSAFHAIRGRYTAIALRLKLNSTLKVNNNMYVGVKKKLINQQLCAYKATALSSHI